jgi:predicted acylesterase/phospholipase RssA
MSVHALSLPGCGCRGAFQIGVLRELARRGERFDIVAGASSGSVSGAVFVAGLAASGPDFFREMARTPIVSARYLSTERSPFGMAAIVRAALTRFVPEESIRSSRTELLVATARARKLLASIATRTLASLPARGKGGAARAAHAGQFLAEALAVHSSRERTNMHDVILASCTIPPIYASLVVLDGEVHVDGGAADNTLISTLLARGADEITVISPYRDGAVSPTLFQKEVPPAVPPGVKLRLIWPERTLSIGRFDFDRGRIEEALTMPFVERVVEARRK